MTEYKIRLFYKPEVFEKIAKGKIEIRKGNENYVKQLVGENLLNCSKIIIEIV